MTRLSLPKAIQLCIAILLCFSTEIFSQDFNQEANRHQKLGDSLEHAKQYKSAARHYQAEVKLRKMIAYKKQASVNAGYSYAMAQMPDSALVCFENAVRQFGLSNSNWLDTEPALAQVRKLKRFTELRKYMSELQGAQQDPDQAMFVTSDINLFWKAYDLYQKDSSNAQKIFLTEYFEKGSPSLQEYYRIKTPNIGGLKGFVHNIKKMPRFYESIRANTEQVAALEDTIRVIYRNLKRWYKPSKFPNTTFVIGAWSSGGTVTNYGSILGADMQSANANTPISELNLWQQKNLIPFVGLKHVVAHELVHVQQNNMAGDTTLLCHAIQEGMADFLGELISGKTANERLQVWAVGNEKKVWAEFKKEMYLDRYSNWIANSNQETADRPSDLGYWVGYQICKAYFEQASDKKKAISDMLNIKDYKAFLIQSKADEKLSGSTK
ncbi:DUF2268 domain-containing putative Zn-dependent protease [Dyadobacter sp. CY312]|uniref:gliding motility protein GldB-related protein n=1 Tax=Dyadobacter sp. CY312 TaxID=2907303 RepID=UPI001F1CC14B|nr:DUF2268 domain-containing putative Zn-dependent protease [Dyadobacter sp. CY312]MCE7042449.1 DUF2268 domain-containing protein [Dyadobacter sp. CY312]